MQGLLGDRYGWRPPPTTLRPETFAWLCQHAATPEERQRLQRWYALDRNALPAEYRLRPVSAVLASSAADESWATAAALLVTHIDAVLTRHPMEDAGLAVPLPSSTTPLAFV